MKQVSSEHNTRIKSDRTNTSDQPISDSQIAADIEVLDQVIAQQEAMERAREKVRKGWVARPDFWSDPPDPYLMPFSGNSTADYDASWDELWYLVGAYLFDAMAQHENESP
ncbi:MAG: hypothetical protein OXF06_02225 [Bacteroidetes bacterium]|nr:hypothetical protein [Bacteroidota bacterium]